MKKFGIVICLLINSLVISGCGGSEATVKKLSVYPFDSAIIKYELTGASEGEETLYIKGDLTSDHKFVSQQGAEESTLELNLGNEMYVADLLKMTAVKVTNDDYAKLTKLSADDQKKEFVKTALGLKESAQAPAPAGTKTVAGQTCDLYIIENVGTACLWNSVVLEKEVTVLGITSKKTAVSVAVNADISKDRFELPAGVIVKN